MFSFLIKDNPLFRIAERILIGAYSANMFNLAVETMRKNVYAPFAGGDYLIIVPVILGLALFGVYLPLRYNFIARYGIAILVGIGTGVAVKTAIPAQIISQILVTIKAPVISSNPVEALGNILLVVGMLSAFTYFIFTREHTGVWGYMAKWGVWWTMLGLGFVVSTYLMMLVAILSGQIEYILKDFLGFIR
jgi:hypothetical protein